MQQVLLAGGPYPADGLVSSLEICTRRSGAALPAIGHLTFDHLAPLQKFVNEHCTASKVIITFPHTAHMKIGTRQEIVVPICKLDAMWGSHFENFRNKLSIRI